MAEKRLPFNPAYDFTATKVFVHDAFKYHPGDPFPKERDGSRAGPERKAHIPERLSRQLYDQFKIDGSWPGEGVQQGQPVTEQDADGDEPVQAATPAATEPQTAEAAAAAQKTMKHTGFGKWSILGPTGEVLEAGLTKADAETRLTA